MTLTIADKILLSQFGIKDVNGDGNFTVGEQADAEMARQIARTSSEDSANEINSADVELIQNALDANAVIKASLSAGKTDRAMKMTGIFLAQIDEYKNLLKTNDSQFQAEHPYLGAIGSHAPVQNIYDLSLSGDTRDQWMAHTILSITAYLWPDVTNPNCASGYSQNVCAASKAIAANTKDLTGNPYTRPVDIGSSVVLPQLQASLLKRVLND